MTLAYALSGPAFFAIGLNLTCVGLAPTAITNGEPSHASLGLISFGLAGAIATLCYWLTLALTRRLRKRLAKPRTLRLIHWLGSAPLFLLAALGAALNLTAEGVPALLAFIASGYSTLRSRTPR